MDESVLFYFSKGSDTRREIVRVVEEKEDEGIYLNKLAEELDLSHVAVRKHLELLLENSYLEYINPEGKPKYLELTEKGERVLEDFTQEN
ncbi:MAG: helix-turn-helix domain-containing protein [Candidatus Nanosalina sp.]